MTDLDQLVADLQAARDAATAVAGHEPVGVRAVEPVPARRWFLCAFEGPRFLCLDSVGVPERRRLHATEVAGSALLVERVEELIDLDELTVCSGLARRVAGFDETSDQRGSLDGLAETVDILASWCQAPERVVASMHGLDQTVARHDAARRWHERFVEASEPLVARQDSLPGELIDALRDLDAACHRAGLGESLAHALGASIEAIDAGTVEMLDQHLTPLD